MVSLQCVDVEGQEQSDIMNVEHEQEDWRKYWDDVSGEELDSAVTKAARREEIEAIHSMKVYTKVPIAQCLAETGRRPVGTRWVDTNKGDSINPKVRCRLVAQDVAVGKIPDFFAATPPHLVHPVLGLVLRIVAMEQAADASDDQRRQEGIFLRSSHA
jgi:hypothetical protein